MKITCKREIILQRERSVTIKFNDESREMICLGCGKKVHFLTVDEAAAVSQTTSRGVFKIVEVGQVHFQETIQGRLMVCFDSLLNLIGESEKFLSKSNE